MSKPNTNTKTADQTTADEAFGEVEGPAPMAWDPIADQNAKRAEANAKIKERALELALKQIAKDEARKANPKTRANKEPLGPRTEPCECGCLGIPAGRKSRFLPGHDAKALSAEIKAIKAGFAPAPVAEETVAED